MTKERFLIVVPPRQLGELRGIQAVPAHLAYRIGKEGHLLRMGGQTLLRGGVIVIGEWPRDAAADPEEIGREIVRECLAQGFSGAVCDWEGPIRPEQAAVLQKLDGWFSRRSWSLYVPERCGANLTHARVMIPSALSGGALEQRLREAAERFGVSRVALALQRTAEDFLLPSPLGSGTVLSRETLERKLEHLHPAVFYSQELCARYFTYRTQGGNAHFVLYDDGDTLCRKIELARRMGVETVLAPWEEIRDALDVLGLRPSSTKRIP